MQPATSAADNNGGSGAVPTATFDFVVVSPTTNQEDELTGRALFENRTGLKKVICRKDGFTDGEPFPLCQGGKNAQPNLVLKFVYTHVPMRVIFATLVPSLLYGFHIVTLIVFYYLIRFLFGGSARRTKPNMIDCVFPTLLWHHGARNE
jgi:hypothetical protein